MKKIRQFLVKIKHNSKLLTKLWYLIRQPKFKYKECKLQIEAKKRKNGFEDKKYISIKNYKGKYLGKRCFIIATGPSLTISDIELLKKEYTFGMNSIVKLYKDTNWRPTFYGIQDSNVYQKLEKDIKKEYTNSKNIFISSEIKKMIKYQNNYNQLPIDFAYHNNQLEIEKYFAKFSEDCYSIVYDGYSITYTLIQLAIYMGFNEIYLIGVDCNYVKGEKNHFVESGFVDKNENKNHEKMIVAYKEARKFADEHNINIINCTRGGMLEEFERKNLEEVLKGGKDNYEDSRSSANEVK